MCTGTSGGDEMLGALGVSKATRGFWLCCVRCTENSTPAVSNMGVEYSPPQGKQQAKGSVLRHRVLLTRREPGRSARFGGVPSDKSPKKKKQGSAVTNLTFRAGIG